MKTRITELLGVQYPLLQGGMAWIADSQLAAAVSNAGGVGLIAGGAAPVDYIRDQIRRAKELRIPVYALVIQGNEISLTGFEEKEEYHDMQVCKKHFSE